MTDRVKTITVSRDQVSAARALVSCVGDWTRLIPSSPRSPWRCRAAASPTTRRHPDPGQVVVHQMQYAEYSLT